MDILTFLAFLSFQLAVLGILAIVYSQNKLAQQVVSALTRLSGKLFQKAEKQDEATKKNK